MSHIAGTGVYCFAINPTSNCAQPGLAAADTPISPPSFIASSRNDGATWFTVGRALYRVAASGSLVLVFAPSTRSVLTPPSIDARGRAVVGYWPNGRTGRLALISPTGGTTLLVGRATPCALFAETYACGDGGFASSAAIGHQVTSVAVARNGDIYFTDQGGEVRFIPVPGRSPSRLAVALPGPKTVRRGASLQIAFRTTRPARITATVVDHGSADTDRNAGAVSLGTLRWAGRVHGMLLHPGNYVLNIRATTSDGRVASRAIRIRITA